MSQLAKRLTECGPQQLVGPAEEGRVELEVECKAVSRITTDSATN